nr:excisionase [Stutzerimonas stutzeri]
MEWAKRNYESPPTLNTLRRWAREGRIYPQPVKHGRGYYLLPNASYLEPLRMKKAGGSDSLVDRIERDRTAESLVRTKR